jgi:4-hydroxy-tetrahydrodipicolinate reductase
MAERIKVAIAGINGRMGKASARLVSSDEDLQMVAAIGRPQAAYVGQDAGILTFGSTAGILVSNSIEELPAEAKPDVLLDFSLAEAAFETAKKALERGIRPVIGASGLGEDKISTLSKLAESKGLGAMVVPNFSVGAVLMMEFARQAGAFFENVEIVEMHHTKKVDAPSGTAMHTVAKLAGNERQFNKSEVQEKELLPHARGAQGDSGVRVHSLRLPGLISHQEVIFGAPGELLTVRHDSFNTDCFLKGIKLAVVAVVKLDRLVVGLDKVLSLSGTTEKEKIGGRSN